MSQYPHQRPAYGQQQQPQYPQYATQPQYEPYGQQQPAQPYYPQASAASPLGRPQNNNPYNTNNNNTAYNASSSPSQQRPPAQNNYGRPAYGQQPQPAAMNVQPLGGGQQYNRPSPAFANNEPTASASATAESKSNWELLVPNRSREDRVRYILNTCKPSNAPLNPDFSMDAHIRAQIVDGLDMKENGADDMIKELLDDAMSEHSKRQIDMFVGGIELEQWGGRGIASLYTFVKYQLLVLFFIMALQIINFANAASKVTLGFQEENNPTYGQRAEYMDLFITKWTGEVQGAWIAINVICIVILFASCPLYYLVCSRLYPSEKAEREKLHEESGLSKIYAAHKTLDKIIRFNEKCEIDVSAHYRSVGNLLLRRLGAVIVFVVLIVVQIFASFGLTQEEERQRNIGISFAIALLTALLNAIYTLLSRSLTEFEKHENLSNATKWMSLKLVLFKLANIVTVYAAKDYTAQATNNCVYDIIGEQFLALFLVEIFLVPLGAVIFTGIWASNYQTIAEAFGSINGDAENLPQFDPSIEYLKFHYKMYLTAMAMTVFPLSGVLAFFAFLVEFFAGRFRLFKICGRPNTTSDTQRVMTSIIMLGLCVASLATPFAGDGWILSGRTGSTVGSAPTYLVRCQFPK